jgi:hypothetical protein
VNLDYIIMNINSSKGDIDGKTLKDFEKVLTIFAVSDAATKILFCVRLDCSWKICVMEQLYCRV